MKIFNGEAFAQKKLEKLKKQISLLKKQGRVLQISAIVFKEDQASLLYSDLKAKAAEEVGIVYERYFFSLTDNLSMIVERIKKENTDNQVTGIIIQKPAQKVWLQKQEQEKFFLGDFMSWWQSLVKAIEQSKDVDGLHPNTLAAIKDQSQKNKPYVLPATAQAVLDIIGSEKIDFNKAIIIGRSDLLAKPLFYEFKNCGKQVEMLGKQEFNNRIEQKKYLHDADLIITATGIKSLIQKEMLANGVSIIDVGEPHPDVNWESVKDIVNFITPVPKGVGPVTIACLLENCYKLHNFYKKE